MKKPQDRKNVGKNAGQKLQMQDRREDDRQDVNWTGRIMDIGQESRDICKTRVACQIICRTEHKQDRTETRRVKCSPECLQQKSDVGQDRCRASQM